MAKVTCLVLGEKHCYGVPQAELTGSGLSFPKAKQQLEPTRYHAIPGSYSLNKKTFLHLVFAFHRASRRDVLLRLKPCCRYAKPGGNASDFLTRFNLRTAVSDPCSLSS